MYRQARTIGGAAASVVLVILALWSWQHASPLVAGWNAENRRVAMWAVRTAAVAVLAAAQVILLTWTVGGLYRRDLLSDMLRLTAGMVFTVAVICAIALGLASR